MVVLIPWQDWLHPAGPEDDPVLLAFPRGMLDDVVVGIFVVASNPVRTDLMTLRI